MNKRRQTSLAAGLVILLLVALAAGIPRTHFATSVIDLLPGEDTEVRILRELAERDQGRLLNVRLDSSSPSVAAASADAFAASLQSSPAIGRVWMAGGGALEEAGAALFANRYPWLLPFWLDHQLPGWGDASGSVSADLARIVVDRMEGYLESPEGMALVDTIPSDPFLLMEQVLESAGSFTHAAPGQDVFLWVRQQASPFVEAGQEPVFAALQAALTAARAIQPDLQMEHSGVARFAAASKAGIKDEIGRLNLLGLLFVLAVTLFWVRAIQAVVRIALVVLVALLAAAAVVITAFPSVHVIALVIGSILTGIAVDYGFHLILVERRRLPERAVLKAVITGSLSSALGFIVLLLSPLPFLQQVGAFVGAGLIAALLAALFLRPGPEQTVPVRPWQLNPFSLPAWTGPLLLVLFLPGLHSLHWQDRINDLEYPLPELKATETRLRQQASLIAGKSVFLIHAASAAEARRRLAGLPDKADDDPLIHLGKWIPTLEQSAGARDFFRQQSGFADALRTEMAGRDFLPDAFEPFFAEWDAYLATGINAESYTSGLSRFAAALPGPLGGLVHVGDDLSWFMVLAPEGFQPAAAAGLLELDQGGMLSNAFAAYRRTMILFGGSCLLALAAGVLAAYGLKAGLLALALPLLAVLIAYGVSGYAATGLSLFHVVGTLLAFCIGLDYALFAVEGHRRGFRLPGSISISALTTIGVFAILATSQIPAIRQLALTVLTIIAATLMLIAAGWPLVRRGAVPGDWCFRRLPHGGQALFVRRVESVGPGRIGALCDPQLTGTLSPEWMLEALAQTAAVLLAYTKAKGSRQRTGMLVVVQDCQINTGQEAAAGPVLAEVESLTEAAEGLLVFKGCCTDANQLLLVEATFSIFIPPEQADARSPDG